MTLINGEVSFWHYKLGGRPEIRAQLSKNLDKDIVIVGGGFTGLWTAYYLKKENPELDIALLEANFCGFGASGRNGGYVSAGISLAKDRDSGEQNTRLRFAVRDSIAEVISRIAEEGIDADQEKVGSLLSATNHAQLKRLTETPLIANQQFLDAEAFKERINIPSVLGGILEPETYTVNPGKLVRQLAGVVEKLGVEIYENTRVDRVENHHVYTAHGFSAKANVIVIATEGYLSSIKGFQRTRIPMNSSMIATQVVPEEVWDEIGWRGREALSEATHAVLYSQHTLDGRIAIGGRGYPYRYGSATDTDGVTQTSTIRALTEILNRWLPVTKSLEIEHAWSGVLGVPRDWSASVRYDSQTGIAVAGGYVGSGVVVSNLSARTLRDLILKKKSELVDQVWVNHMAKKWEVEPFRWLGVHTMYKLYNRADDIERRNSASDRTSKIARFANLITSKPN